MKEVFKWSKEHMHIIFGVIILTITVSLIVFSIYQSETQPKEGIVIRKDYQPPYTTIYYRTITQSDGKRTEIPMQEYHDARYQIIIKGINSKGKESLGYYYVTPIEYEEIKVGDYYIKELN